MTQAAQTDPAGAIANWVAALDPSDIPDSVIDQARLHVLDALGVALAAADTDFAQKTIAGVRAISTDGRVPIIGHAVALPPRDAALVNGVLVHGLDFDDTHSEAVTHTSASALPLALSAADPGCSGRRFLAGFVTASEITARVGAAARGRFHDRGFHPTGTAGAFGAVAGAGFLHGHSAQNLWDAQGIVLSMAGGSFEFLSSGAWTKRLHPGWAAVSGLTASALAAHGFVGPDKPYAGRFGLYNLYTDDGRTVQIDRVGDALGERWEFMNIAFKPYPACHLTHAFVDASTKLKATHGLDPAQIETITALIAAPEMPIVCDPADVKMRPQNAYEAQFSLHYIIAATLMSDGFTLRELLPDSISDPKILSLCRKVTCADDPDSAYPDFYSGALRVTLRDGTQLEQREQINRGSAENPLSASDVERKFMGNATLRFSKSQAERLMDEVMALPDKGDIQGILSAMTCAD